MTPSVRNVRAAIERFADSPHASAWLFVLAAVEASLFPVPPDILLFALCLPRPERSFRYVAVGAAGSVAGALLGYAIGALLFDSVGAALLSLGGGADRFTLVLAQYREHAWSTLLLAGFIPIPFAVFTLAAGFHGTIGLWTFLPAVVAGRSLRFFLVGALLRFAGPRTHPSLMGMLRKFTIVFGVLLVLGVLTMTYLF
jgi:membrane protein YqaA with SNARE-associated domain